MPRTDWTAWLGPAEATDEQIDQLDALDAVLAARYPDADQVSDREASLSGGAQVILGYETPEILARAWHAAQEQAEQARLAMVGAIIVATQAGARESDLARRLSITRPTIRKALGK